MKNREVICAFINGWKEGKNKAGAMYIESFQNDNKTITVLYSYGTPIAYRELTDEYTEFFILNKKFVSIINQHQSMLRKMITQEDGLLCNKYIIIELSLNAFSENLKKYNAKLRLL